MKVEREMSAKESALPDLVAQIRDAVIRRWLTLVLVAGAVFALGAAVTFLMTPQYKAEARVQLDPSRDPLAKSGGQDALSPESIETEVSYINSLDVARAVVERLHLDQDAEMTKGLKVVPSGAGPVRDKQAAVANALLTHLTVTRDKLTYILKIEFTARNPVTAANVANGIADEYLASKVGSRSGVAEKQSAWFQQQLNQLTTELRESDAKVAQYRSAAGIVGAKTGGTVSTVIDQQVAPLSTELAQAKSQAAAANATLASARAQMASGGRDSVSAVLESPVIGDLRRQRADILRNRSEMETRYGDKHPEMIRVRDQLAQIDQQLQEQTNRILSSLSAAAISANARVASLQSSMNELSSHQALNDRSAVLADSMQQEADAKRTQYEKLSALALDATQKAQNSIAQASVIDRAKPPVNPYLPNKPLFLALSLVLGLVIGGATIATQEMMVVGIMSKNDVEQQFGLPMLAAVPAVKKLEHPADLLIDRPTSLFSEAIRIARASILGVKRSDKGQQIIAVTSALPGEGKSTTALAFARMLAIHGSKTLLIECDVRRAILQTHVRNPVPKAGIIEVLFGDAPIEAALFPGDVDNLTQLFATAPFFDSGELFGDARMKSLLDTLRQQYDHIVLDLPPLVGLADSRYLAVQADTTVMVVRWARTPVNAVSTALEWLKSDGANVAGVVLTMIDPGAEAAGAYYYSKKYSGYYQNK